MLLPFVRDILTVLEEEPAVAAALDALGPPGAEVRLAGLTDTAKWLVAATLQAATGRPFVYVVDSNPTAELAAEALRFFAGAVSGRTAPGVIVLPALDVHPYAGLSPHPDIAEARAVSLWKLATRQASIVVAPIGSARLRLREPAFYETLARPLAKDQDVDLMELVAYLESVGYVRSEPVEMTGQFSVRGGILDVFSPESARPHRVELFADTIESIREFDPATQRSGAPASQIWILPLVEIPATPEQFERLASQSRERSADEAGSAGTLAPYPGWEFHPALVESLPGSLLDLAGDAVVVLDEPTAIAQECERSDQALGRFFEEAQSDGQIAVPPERLFFEREEWEEALRRRPRVHLEHLALAGPITAHHISSQPTQKFHGMVPALVGELKERLEHGYQVLVVAANTGEMERLADLSAEYQVPFRLGMVETEHGATRELSAQETIPAGPGRGGAVVLMKGTLAEGVVFPDSRLAVFGNQDLFEAVELARRPMRPRSKSAAFRADFRDLKIGDFVVHEEHGIGQFLGVKELEVDGARQEFMVLLYADEAKLYLPLARLDLVQKYRNLDSSCPLLDRLGGLSWQRTTARIRRSLRDMAAELLRLYAQRKTISGHTFSPDSEWEKEFEASFEYEETPDQAVAIEEIKRDLCSPRPTDRLLCGDVGYGKTEVAMRAAFKVVCDNHQVALLAPTTVLAFQHFETFRQRFAPFPVRIELLSRFRSRAEQKRVLEELGTGRVDIVIGTHRLLSKDVDFPNLGLLVVDEEQRFGVAHKERIKQLKKDVDVLTLTATPIPRTLHMALAGVRDMSLIETPPKDRLAIQTIAAPFSESLIQRAIEQELERGGQVYFVHNRIHSIHSMAELLRRLTPRARVSVAHGQMKESELERIMLRFMRHESDVLLCTTIIENGLDIPNVNTILINRADRYGLAELYQLRGRVGRSNRRAYAYLLVPPGEALPSTSRQRLAALKEFSELGAGFRIAALDLELRGAGNLLGREQHGHIQAVGFDLYCQMLERAVEELKGEPPAPEVRTTLNLGVDIRIPTEYIEEESQRLRMYKRIAAIRTDEHRGEVERELEDRYGPLPRPVRHLLDYASLRAICQQMAVEAVERRQGEVVVKFHESARVDSQRLVAVVRRTPGARFDPVGVLRLPIAAEGGRLIESLRKQLLELQL